MVIRIWAINQPLNRENRLAIIMNFLTKNRHLHQTHYCIISKASIQERLLVSLQPMSFLAPRKTLNRLDVGVAAPVLGRHSWFPSQFFFSESYLCHATKQIVN